MISSVWPPRAHRVEHALATALPSLLGAGVFAVAFVHVHDTARWAGQPEWASWLLALTGELMAIAAVVEIRARRRDGGSLFWPVLVLVASIAFSGACNLVAAYGLETAPGHWVPIMAIWPVISFALVAGLKATRTAHAPVAVSDEVVPVPAAPPITVESVPAAPPADPQAAVVPVPEPIPAPAPSAGTGATRRRGGRHVLAELVATLPADDPRSERQLAADLAPEAGLAESTRPEVPP